MKIIRHVHFSIAALLALLISGSVSGQNKKLTDPEIASIAVTADKINVKLAEIAKEKASNREIIKYANLMLRDHQTFIDQTTSLENKLGIVPKDCDITKKLVSDADNMIMVLNTKTGSDFNRTYINDEIQYHTEVLNTMQGQLIPQVKNAELKEMLEKALPVRKSNLEDAETVREILPK